MVKVKKSEYIKISKTILKKLFSEGCWGAGSMYEDNLKKSILEDGKKIQKVIEALTRQGLICKKPKEYGIKYFLNPDRREKIMEILKEKPRKRNSILLLLFFDL